MPFNILDVIVAQNLVSHLGESEFDDLKGFLTVKVFLNTYMKDWKTGKQMGNSKTSIQFGDISLTIPRELYEKNLPAFVKYGQCLHYAYQPATFTTHLAIDCNDKVDPYYDVPERIFEEKLEQFKMTILVGIKSDGVRKYLEILTMILKPYVFRTFVMFHMALNDLGIPN